MLTRWHFTSSHGSVLCNCDNRKCSPLSTESSFCIFPDPPNTDSSLSQYSVNFTRLVNRSQSTLSARAYFKNLDTSLAMASAVLSFFLFPSTVWSQFLNLRISPTIANLGKCRVLFAPSSGCCSVCCTGTFEVAGVGLGVGLGVLGVSKHFLIVLCPWDSGLSVLAEDNAFLLSAGVRSLWRLERWLLSFFGDLDLHPAIGHHLLTSLLVWGRCGGWRDDYSVSFVILTCTLQ